MSQYDALLKPLRLKHLVLRNRIMSTAHAPRYAEDGMPAERYQLYHEEKAKGGIGLTMFGGSSTVAVDSPLSFKQVDLSDDRVVPHIEKMAAGVHRHGAAVFCQMTHLGRRGSWEGREWLPLIGPSSNREILHRSFAKEMEDWDFRRVIENFADAAERCRKGGLDGIEIIAAAHHLIDSFLSPAVNQRTDRYGGSLENRMRFGMEVLEAIRARVGPDFIVGMRLAGDELLEGGLDATECLKIAAGYANSGLIDFLNIYQSHGDTFRGLVTLMPDMAFPPAPYLYLASAVKGEVDIPIFHASAIRDLATAARAIEEGHVDMVAMTRAHIADPYIARKLMEGRADDIRQCVGANMCVDSENGAVCIQNAATGREKHIPHIVRKGAARKRVVVVGGGPGGLEAARVSALRGHEVVLFERSGRLGGQLNLAKNVAWREGLSGIVRWLEMQLGKEGVDIRINTSATMQLVQAEAPDIVVIATGGSAKPPGFEGGELAISAWSLLSGESQAGANVLVYDEIGSQVGVGCADYLGTRKALVELVTPDRHVGEQVGSTAQVHHLKRLYQNDVVLTPNVRVIRAYKEGNGLVAVLRNEYTDSMEERSVDQIVYELGSQPVDDLYWSLRPDSVNFGEVDYDELIVGRPQAVRSNPEGRFQLFRIGDAVHSRNAHAAMYDAVRLMKDL
jgi:2,4-dienoyl-CoA reductase-like NADH-dependent reductase (Old Yellow Enzyme family)/thioredoxin reductase